MRKTLLYTLYVIAAILACIAIYAAARSGKPDPLILLFFLSPVLLNALRKPKLHADKHVPAGRHPVELRAKISNADAAESLSVDLSKLFKILAKILLGISLFSFLFTILTPYLVVAGFTMIYALIGSVLSYGLAKAFE